MDKAKPIPGVDLISVLIIEESSDIFKGLCYRAPDSRSLDALPRVALFATARCATVALVHGETVACLYLCKTLPGQDIAYIDRPSCNNMCQ